MIEDKKQSHNKEMKPSLSETEDIIGRLKKALDVRSDGQLAKYLGITRQNIGAARKRDDVPPGWIYKVAELSGCSMDWLRFGQGPQKRSAYPMAESEKTGGLSSQASAYRLQVSWKPRPVDDLQSDADGTGFGMAVEMLAKIYGSEDQLLIGAINSDLRAFCEAIDRKQRDQHSTTELNELKKRLATIERQLKQEP
ncbi:MAG: helix-turn-helix domain-containing protein [Desulfobacterales bacterium]|nr:helix-turn-helix domain-containing protein [Desulfobacterales bacterium]